MDILVGAKRTKIVAIKIFWLKMHQNVFCARPHAPFREVTVLPVS